MSNDPDFVTVRPREIRLTHRGVDDHERRFELPSWRTMAFVGVGLAVVVLMFAYTPSWTPAPQTGAPATPVDTTPSAPASPATTQEPEQPPLEKLISDRERARAQDTLSRYVELQIRLEDEMHVDVWAKDRYAALEDVAAKADELFTQRRYDDAMKGYNDAANGLAELVAEGESRFETARADATTALQERRLDAAREALAQATAIHPDHASLAPLYTQLAKLPTLIEAVRAAEEALRAGDEAGARSKYREALVLDPDSLELRQRLADLDGRLLERRFQETLSAGYGALEAGRFDDARAAFNRALAERPGDLGARQGLEQVKQSGTLERLQQLQEGASRLEAEERWADAVKAYNEVLVIDPALKFAVDGKARAVERAALDRKLEDTIGHPERLSDDDVYRESVALRETAAAVAELTPRLAGQVAKLTDVLAVAAQPVAITLLSDNATQVTISHVGPLGVFAEKRLSLRPGRYLVIGSRDGCRDVRKQVDVAADMSPIEIRCEERL